MPSGRAIEIQIVQLKHTEAETNSRPFIDDIFKPNLKKNVSLGLTNLRPRSLKQTQVYIFLLIIRIWTWFPITFDMISLTYWNIFWN